ncbi:MAG: hypothetical protein PHE55_18000 [Methylococcaceae bacterium]|nr:hypothetical protein [Methylococcaceae bacterium]
MSDGVMDGLGQQDLRRFGGGRECGQVYLPGQRLGIPGLHADVD